MKLKAFAMLPFAKSLLGFLQIALAKGAIIISEKGISIQEEQLKEALNEILVEEMKNWNPEYNGKKILDNKTKLAGARFLAGVACSMLEAVPVKEEN